MVKGGSLFPHDFDEKLLMEELDIEELLECEDIE
jgi:hypothetical protein